VLFKSPQDAPWHASALEGLATISVIEAWVTGHGLVRLMSKFLYDGHSNLLAVFLGWLFQQWSRAMDRYFG